MTVPSVLPRTRLAVPPAPLAVPPAPLAEAPRLAAAPGAGTLYVKRDDLTGFAFGGNKARVLELPLPAAPATAGHP